MTILGIHNVSKITAFNEEGNHWITLYFRSAFDDSELSLSIYFNIPSNSIDQDCALAAAVAQAINAINFEGTPTV